MSIVAQSRLPNQYVASASQTIFVYNYKIFVNTDLDVYLTPVGAEPDPVNDLLTVGTDYTVTGVGTEGGGTIVLTTPATAGDIITIESDVSNDQTVNFIVGGVFAPETVTNVMDKFTILLQQLSGILMGRGLLYPPNEDLDDTSVRKDNVLPVLPVKTTGNIPIWSKDDSGNLIATEIDEDADASTLRADLANDSSGIGS